MYGFDMVTIIILFELLVGIGGFFLGKAVSEYDHKKIKY